jgi:DNA modification methylase
MRGCDMLELNKIYNMDNIDGLKLLDDNSIDAIVTDPPYGLSFMNKKWDYDVPSVELWKECLRVLKYGGYLLSFAGTRTQHRMACRIEDAGFEIRDMIAWVYGSGFPKSLNIGKAIDKLQGNEREDLGKSPAERLNKPKKDIYDAGIRGKECRITKGNSEWEGWGTALKPSLEPITVARKPLSESTVAENVLKWRTGGINIDACRVGGRFPANFIHDGSEEVTRLFPNTKSGNDCVRKKEGTFIEHGGLGKAGDVQITYGDNGNASRFFYCAKASASERNDGCENMEETYKAGAEFRPNHMKKAETGEDGNPYGRWNKTTNYHPTVKPISLMEYLVKLVSRENAIILDPFMGSGTTAIACHNLQRNFYGFEIDKGYCEIAEKRLAKAMAQMTIFEVMQ